MIERNIAIKKIVTVFFNSPRYSFARLLFNSHGFVLNRSFTERGVNMAKEVIISIEGLYLFGSITIPEAPRGWIIFAHGSGSSRNSTRNQWVASELNKVGFATLLFDLLTQEEDSIYENRFNIPLLAQRLFDVTNWLVKNPIYKDSLPIGLYGASTGAGAAIEAAAIAKKNKKRKPPIKAIVSRGGRPDLANIESLAGISTPTLLLVGELDPDVIIMNRKANDLLHHSELKIIKGATHLFEEPGTLDEVVIETKKWFLTYLEKPRPSLFA